MAWSHNLNTKHQTTKHTLTIRYSNLHCIFLPYTPCPYFSINFKQFEKPQKDLPANSEVLKALQEQEGHLKGVAGLAEFQEDRGASSN